jgi:16S rRNA (cytosine967-C5)-methyltransferase
VAKVIAEVLNGHSLTEVLGRYQLQVADRDRAVLAELSYGICREFFYLDALAELLLKHPLKSKDQDVRALALSGLYQLLFTRIPEHAAIGETAGAARLLKKKWAVALINGILRRFQRERLPLIAKLEDRSTPETKYNQPLWLIEALQKAWPKQAEAVLQGLQQRPPFSLRVNLSQSRLSDYLSTLATAGLPGRPVTGVDSAIILEKPVAVSSLPGFEAGKVSVQDVGAQMAAFLLDIQPGMRVLDACAAPGGKTGHMLEQVSDIDMVAMDVDEKRLARVNENMQRLGFAPGLVVGDASDPQGAWSNEAFDRILVDAPCTATGVMRRHPDIKLLRRREDAEALVVRQKAILAAEWQMLKPGGKMLYATCSLLPMENDEQIHVFLETHEDARAVMLQSGLGISTRYGLQLLPDTMDTDGFYYSLLEKQEA